MVTPFMFAWLSITFLTLRTGMHNSFFNKVLSLMHRCMYRKAGAYLIITSFTFLEINLV